MNPQSDRETDPQRETGSTQNTPPLVENFFARIKTFRRVATRYDKLSETFSGWVLLAVVVKFRK